MDIFDKLKFLANRIVDEREFMIDDLKCKFVKGNLVAMVGGWKPINFTFNEVMSFPFTLIIKEEPRAWAHYD